MEGEAHRTHMTKTLYRVTGKRTSPNTSATRSSARAMRANAHVTRWKSAQIILKIICMRIDQKIKIKMKKIIYAHLF